MLSLSGKRAVVTGGASGIGLAIGQAFLTAGADVALVDLDQEKAAETAAAMVGLQKNAAYGFGCDVSDTASVEACFSLIETQMGAPNVVVNCAGIAHVGSLATTEPEDLERLFAVNVKGTYLVMRAALQEMIKARQGVILNMASIAATAGLTDRFAYSMTKGAVRAMTLSVAKDYIADGIRCNCISPARVYTAFVEGFLKKNYPGQEAEKAKELALAQPIGRMGTPEEIATLALYLCSDEASFVTGADYVIDGGFITVR